MIHKILVGKGQKLNSDRTGFSMINFTVTDSGNQVLSGISLHDSLNIIAELYKTSSEKTPTASISIHFITETFVQSKMEDTFIFEKLSQEDKDYFLGYLHSLYSQKQ